MAAELTHTAAVPVQAAPEGQHIDTNLVRLLGPWDARDSIALQQVTFRDEMDTSNNLWRHGTHSPTRW